MNETSRLLDDIEEEPVSVPVSKDVRVVQCSTTIECPAGEVCETNQNTQFARHPMRITDEELHGEVWDLMV